MDRTSLDKVLQNEVDSGFVTGVNALVYHKGQEVYYGQAGVRSLATNAPMDRDTIVRLYSMSKPVTAVATMILIERGILSLEDPVEKYLPEFDLAGLRVYREDGSLIPATHSITIWDLLHMTSGIPYPDDNFPSGRQMGEVFWRLIEARKAGQVVTTRDYAKEIAKVPLCFRPGEGWLYGLSADILGAVIEVASGMRYDEFLQKEIFLPLGMKDTGFYVPEAKANRFAVAYEWKEPHTPTPFTDCFLGEYYGEDAAFLSGGAGMVSTANDYMRFNRMLSGGGTFREDGREIRILSEESVRYMSADHLQPIQRKDFLWDTMKGYGYGCLMRSLLHPEEAHTLAPIGEFGWDGWMGCYMQVDPVHDVDIVYLIQRAGAGTSAGSMAFRNEVYRSLKLG